MLQKFVSAVKKSVTDTASALVDASESITPDRLTTIYAPTTNAATVFVGGAGVDTTDGFPVAPGGSIDLPVDPRGIYAVVAVTATDVLHVVYC